MKAATIASSAIGKYGRMDAGFHIAVQQVQAKATELEARHTAQELVDKLARLELADLKPLTPLLRASRDHGRREDYLRAAQEYPFIAYALASAGIEAAIARTEALLSEHQGYLAHLRGLQGT